MLHGTSKIIIRDEICRRKINNSLKICILCSKTIGKKCCFLLKVLQM